MPLDVQVLQTAASLENLAVASYAAAARLPAIRDAGPALAGFIARSQAQHAAHARAFNARVVAAGGRAQHEADHRYAADVRRSLTHRAGAVAVANLLELLEDVNAQSYTRYASLIRSPELRRLFVSVSVAEAGHRSFLLAAAQLLDTGTADLIRSPTVPRDLPAAIGSACAPLAFYPTAEASAIGQGALR